MADTQLVDDVPRSMGGEPLLSFKSMAKPDQEGNSSGAATHNAPEPPPLKFDSARKGAQDPDNPLPGDQDPDNPLPGDHQDRATQTQYSLPEEVIKDADPGLLSGFQSWASEAKLSNSQASLLATRYATAVKRADQRIDKFFADEAYDWKQTLVKEFGAGLPAQHSMVDAALHAAGDAGAELKRWLRVTGHAGNPVLVKALGELGRKLKNG